MSASFSQNLCKNFPLLIMQSGLTWAVSFFHLLNHRKHVLSFSDVRNKTEQTPLVFPPIVFLLCVCVYVCVLGVASWNLFTWLITSPPAWILPLFLYLWIKDHFHFSHSPRLFSCYCGNNTMVNSVYFLLAVSSSVSSSPLFLDSCHHLHPSFPDLHPPCTIPSGCWNCSWSLVEFTFWVYLPST